VIDQRDEAAGAYAAGWVDELLDEDDLEGAVIR
jgi:hypothetical protein